MNVCHRVRPTVERTIAAIAPVFRNRMPVAMLAVVFMLTCTGRCTAPESRPAAEVIEGWVDGDTYRVRTTGVPSRKINHPQYIKGTARAAAIIAARKRFIDNITDEIMSCATYRDDRPSLAYALKVVFTPTSYKGEVRESFDKDSICSIVYDIREKGLKARVDNYFSVPAGGKSTAVKDGESGRCEPFISDGKDIPVCDSGIIEGYGWTGDDIYTCDGYGVPPGGASGRDIRRKLAEERALRDAGSKFISQFSRMIIEGYCSHARGVDAGDDPCDPSRVKAAISKKFCRLISSGKVICRRFRDNDACEIVVRVREKKLREQVQSVIP